MVLIHVSEWLYQGFQVTQVDLGVLVHYTHNMAPPFVLYRAQALASESHFIILLHLSSYTFQIRKYIKIGLNGNTVK